MKRRESLLRLKRFRVDDLKRRTATLDGMQADVTRKLSDLEDSVVRERQRANDSDIGRLAFPSFLRAMDTRRENLRATLKEIERERVQAEVELGEAHQNVKILELAAEQEAKRAAETQLRKSGIDFDEFALGRHPRKHALRQG